LRKQYPVIASGDYQAYEPDHPQVYGYLRQLDGQKLLVLTNFYENETTITIPEEFVSAQPLISNYANTLIQEEVTLRPYQAIA
ncbi:alpha-glucosidase C-terminal domain-containing protein, partial [Vibrio parahaemolyticus]|nr:alpha-glucosidase C-terminal domain-containing protein [Vibrio parahaemolyticus]